MTRSKHLGNESIITMECVALIYKVLMVKLNDFFNLEIEGNSKVIINYYNKKNSLSILIIILINDILGLTKKSKYFKLLSYLYENK